jgi:hypothetical protein
VILFVLMTAGVTPLASANSTTALLVDFEDSFDSADDEDDDDDDDDASAVDTFTRNFGMHRYTVEMYQSNNTGGENTYYYIHVYFLFCFTYTYRVFACTCNISYARISNN